MISQQNSYALELLEQSLENLQNEFRQQCKHKWLAAYGIYAKQLQINLERKSYFQADEMIGKAIQYLKKIGDSILIQVAMQLKFQGDIKLQMGYVKTAEQKYRQSLQKIIQVKIYPEKALKQLNSQYWWDYFFNFQKNTDQLDKDWEQRKNQIKIIQTYINQKQLQINCLLLNIKPSIKKVCRYLGKKQSFQNCQDDLQSAYKIIDKMFQLSSVSQNPYQKARYLSIKAQTMIEDYEGLAWTQMMLLQCIEQIQSNNPVDIQAFQLRKVLNKIRQVQLDIYITPPLFLLNTNFDRQNPYDQIRRDQLYRKMKDNLQRLLVIASYHTRDPSKIMQIKSEIGNLQYKMNNFQESQKYINQVIAQFQQTDSRMRQINTQYAMLYNAKANIYLERGEFENANQMIKASNKKLQKAL